MRVSRAFDDQQVLTDVSFAVGSGEIHGLIGPNGVGKTTLLRVIAGLMDPTAGSVTVLGEDPKNEKVRTRIGWIPGGDRTFYLRLSGLENLVFFGRMYGMSARSARLAAVDLIDRVGLVGAASRPAGLYSKGMLKRLAVARSLLPQPIVLLCDETTHDLDPDGSVAIRALFADLARQGLAIVWATQRLDELASFAHSVTVLAAGGVAFSGKFSALVDRIPSRWFDVRFAEPVTPGALEALEGLVVSRGTGPDAEYEIEIQVSDTLPIGQVLATLAEKGFMATVINEKGSHVEAAYHHVLGSEPS